jgi:hypothetical protein
MQGHEDTFVIIESRPLDTPPPSDVRHVEITADRAEGREEAKPRPNEIDDVIRRLPPEGVATLSIHHSSRLIRLPPIDRFRNLQVLDIEAKGIKDLGPLFALEHLERLTISGCKADNLSALQGRPFNYIRLIRGNIVRFDLTAWHVRCQYCSHLVSFAGAAISYADLEGCKQVDLSTLASVRRLISLKMVGSGPVAANLDFALGCQELKDLTITTALSKTDFSALGRAPALQSVFLGVRSAVIERLASDSPHLLITNGEVCFRGGQKISYFDDYDRERDASLGIRSPFR